MSCGTIYVGLLLLLCLLFDIMAKLSRTVRLVTLLIYFLFLITMSLRHSENSVDTSYRLIVSDLQKLTIAASRFYDEHKKWPSPGQAASLDEYSDRPIVNAAPSRYARVILLERPFGEVGSVDLFVGVELLPEGNGRWEVQRKLSHRTAYGRLLREPASDDNSPLRYESGLNVYMKVM